jgi:hypothetical protein
MKSILAFVLLLMASVCHAQNTDLIVTTNGDSIRCKITDIQPEKITWADYTTGSTAHIPKDSVAAYKFAFFSDGAVIMNFKSNIVLGNRKTPADYHAIGMTLIAVGAGWLALNSYISEGWGPDGIKASSALGFALISAGAIIELSSNNSARSHTYIKVSPAGAAVCLQF